MRRATGLLALLFLAALIGSGLWKRVIQREVQKRESHFIAIHFLATDAIDERGAAGPKNFEELMNPWGEIGSSLARPFPGGLVFRTNGSSFTLEEAEPRRVSLFHRDRLVATDRKWPRWESSGEYARKVEGQNVPPRGYE